MLLILSACHRAVPTGAKPAAPHMPPPTGEIFAYRFLDHAAEAVATSELPLAQAWSRLSYPAKLVNPYGRGEAAMRVVNLALADADVANYPASKRAPAPKRGRGQAVAFDPVWNRARAVYEYRSGLFAPSPSSYEFHPKVPAGRLRFSYATPPGTGAVRVAVDVDGKRLLERQLDRDDAGRWHEADLPLGDGAEGVQTVRFSTSGGVLGAPVVFASPVLLAAGNPPLNVITVVIDTLRADALPVMPRLRGLGEKSLWCDQAITAATWTRPSLLALFGGDLPTAVGQSAEEMIPNEADRRRFYAVAPPLLPRLLAQRGYLTSAIGNNFFLLGYPQIGLDLGFDEVVDVRHPVLDTPAITAAALAYLREHAKEPFYLHLHYDGPHWPYTPPPEFLRRIRELPAGFPVDAMSRAYLAEAAYSDEHLGKVVDELERLGLSSRTVVVVVGDHGEIFDAAHAHTVEALRLPTLHHHGWSAYDEILRVPLVVSLPGVVAPRHLGAQVRLMDVLPTVAELLGFEVPRALRGRSLLALHDGDGAAERVAFTEGQNVRALRAGGWLYLRRGDGRLTVGTKRVRIDEELYELATDPAQHRDLTTQRPEVLARMRALFEHEAPTPPAAPASVIHLRMAASSREHEITGVIRAATGNILVRGVSHGEVSPVDAHGIRVTLRSPGQLDLAVEPPTSELRLTLRRDGTPLGPGQLLVGPYGLPLLGDGPLPLAAAGAPPGEDLPTAVLSTEMLRWLDAARGPPAGDHGDLTMWRDPGSSLPIPVESAKSTGGDDVATMMRRWGYAQPPK